MATADFKDPSKDPSLTNIDPIQSTEHKPHFRTRLQTVSCSIIWLFSSVKMDTSSTVGSR
jgi:hypothetical protein